MRARRVRSHRGVTTGRLCVETPESRSERHCHREWGQSTASRYPRCGVGTQTKAAATAHCSVALSDRRILGNCSLRSTGSRSPGRRSAPHLASLFRAARAHGSRPPLGCRRVSGLDLPGAPSTARRLGAVAGAHDSTSTPTEAGRGREQTPRATAPNDRRQGPQIDRTC